MPKLELRIDGQTVPHQEHGFYFGEQQVVLPPGEAREITVEVEPHRSRSSTCLPERLRMAGRKIGSGYTPSGKGTPVAEWQR